jgi:tetratricopeptide (TPR) repeat protein
VLRPQAPAPASDPGRGILAADAAALAVRGEELLRREDPVAALATFRALLDLEPGAADALVGLGRAELLLGRPRRALDAADRALARAPGDDAATALRIRALLRDRRFEVALGVSTKAFDSGDAGLETLAAHASALFRMQRNEEAAAVYREVVARDPDHAEAHLRLGSGLTAPRPAPVGPALEAAIQRLRAGDLDAARTALHEALRADPGHPIAHRLLGETLFASVARRSLASVAEEFARVAALLPEARVEPGLAAAFVPDWPDLVGPRRQVVDRALALFGSRLATLIRKGGSHDLLGEDERTTDAVSRVSLRGRRTFDGRVWDDVRGIGGLRAATGIEALDEAADFGFDTLVHEIAHQVHLHGLEKRSIQVRIRELYQRALDEGRCLDYYAATNYAEYFGQGVEAFACLVKRPSREATHGHTRFELLRVDPALHALIAELVDVDPLREDADPVRRRALLEACAAAALRVGRTEDARTAAGLLPAGPDRDRLYRATAALERQIDGA